MPLSFGVGATRGLLFGAGDGSPWRALASPPSLQMQAALPSLA